MTATRIALLGAYVARVGLRCGLGASPCAALVQAAMGGMKWGRA